METRQAIPDFLTQYIPEGFADGKGDINLLKFEADEEEGGDAAGGNAGGWGASTEGGADAGGWGAATETPAAPAPAPADGGWGGQAAAPPAAETGGW